MSGRGAALTASKIVARVVVWKRGKGALGQYRANVLSQHFSVAGAVAHAANLKRAGVERLVWIEGEIPATRLTSSASPAVRQQLANRRQS